MIKEVLKNQKDYYRAFILFLVLILLVRTANECLKFQDPFYQNQTAKQISREAAALADKGDLVWVGGFYGRHPAQYVFHPKDDFTYLYHFYAHVVLYYTNRGIIEMHGGNIQRREKWEMGVWLPKIGGRVKNHDVLMINTEPYPTVTANSPKVINPFLVQRVRIQEWDGVRETEGNEFELYVQRAGEKYPESLGVVKSADIAKKLPDGLLERVFLLDFDTVKVFNG